MPQVIRIIRPLGSAAVSLAGQGPQDGLCLILLQLAMVDTGQKLSVLGLELPDAIKLRDILSLAIIEEQGKSSAPPAGGGG